jgi:hypothetical protein
MNNYSKAVLDSLTSVQVLEEHINAVDIKVYGKYLSLVAGPNGNLLVFIYKDKESQLAETDFNIQIIDPDELKAVRIALGANE